MKLILIIAALWACALAGLLIGGGWIAALCLLIPTGIAFAGLMLWLIWVEHKEEP